MGAPSTTLSQRAATRPRMCQSAKTTIPTWRASWTRRMPEEESRLKPPERQTHMLSNYTYIDTFLCQQNILHRSSNQTEKHYVLPIIVTSDVFFNPLILTCYFFLLNFYR